MRACAVQHSLSLAWHLGRAVLAARFAKRDPVEAVAREGHGRVIFEGEAYSSLQVVAAFVSVLNDCATLTQLWYMAHRVSLRLQTCVPRLPCTTGI